MSNFPFTQQVRQLVGGHWQNPVCIDLAEKIAQRYFHGSPDAIIEQFIYVSKTIESIREQFLGHNKQIEQVNLFVNIIGQLATNKLVGYPGIIGKLIQLEKINSRDEYLKMKLWILRVTLQKNNNLLSYFSDLSKKLEPTLEIIEKQKDIVLSTENVFTELLNLRQYGVKASIFSEGVLTNNSNHYWAFMPVDYFYQQIPIEFSSTWQARKKLELTQKNCLALVTIGTTKEILIEHTYLDGQEVHEIKGSVTGFNINFDGELSSSHDLSLTNVKEVFINKDLGPIYNLLKMQAIFRLYDLIVPMIVHKKYEIKPFPKAQGFLGIPRSVSFNPVLYLQRIRTIFDHRQEFIDSLENEVEVADRKTPTRREHEVISHIRQLPEGYKASEKAKELARNILNYELKDGETYVNRHYRNKGGIKSDNVHQVKLRH